MHMGKNTEGRNKGRVSALYIEGVEHVARHCDGARGEQAIAICSRLVSGLELATRPPAFAEGVRAGCQVVERAAVTQLHSDKKLN